MDDSFEQGWRTETTPPPDDDTAWSRESTQPDLPAIWPVPMAPGAMYEPWQGAYRHQPFSERLRRAPREAQIGLWFSAFALGCVLVAALLGVVSNIITPPGGAYTPASPVQAAPQLPRFSTPPAANAPTQPPAPATATALPSPTPTVTPIPFPVATIVPTATVTPAPTATATPQPTATPAPTATPLPVPTSTPGPHA